MHGQLTKALQQCLTTANMPWLTFSSCLEPRLQVDCIAAVQQAQQLRPAAALHEPCNSSASKVAKSTVQNTANPASLRYRV